MSPLSPIMDTTTPEPTPQPTPEEDQSAKLQLLAEHRKKVNVYRLTENSEADLVKGDLTKQKSTKKKMAPNTNPAAKKQVMSSGVMPTIKKRYAKKVPELATPKAAPHPPPSPHAPIDTDKILLGCVCIGLGLYLIYLTRQGSVVATEVVPDV